jgi:CRISPR-associated protein Cmr6
MTRLLGGVCSNSTITQDKINFWFGHTGSPGAAEIYWNQEKLETANQGNEQTPIFKVKGRLNIKISNDDLAIFQKLLAFSYIMAGWGKTWRRTWHKGPKNWHSGFHPCYQERAIGCHWTCKEVSFEIPNIKSTQNLTNFLDQLQIDIKTYLDLIDLSCQSFKEAWCSNRIGVFSNVVSQSCAVSLFHDDTFKTTLAIGGRYPHKNHPREINPPQSVSCVWHRMLPIDNNQYLEIVTIFHGDRRPWERNGDDQLPVFIETLEDRGLQFTWGSKPKLKPVTPHNTAPKPFSTTPKKKS